MINVSRETEGSVDNHGRFNKILLEGLDGIMKANLCPYELSSNEEGSLTADSLFGMYLITRRNLTRISISPGKSPTFSAGISLRLSRR